VHEGHSVMAALTVTVEAHEGGGGSGGVRNGTGAKAGEVACTWRWCARGSRCVTVVLTVMAGAHEGGGGGGSVRDGVGARARAHGRDGVRARV